MPVFNPIPMPKKGDEDTIVAALTAIIQNLDILTGRIPGGAAVALTLFTKTNITDPDPVGTKHGDLWWSPPITAADKWVRRVWFVGGDKVGKWRLYDDGT